MNNKQIRKQAIITVQELRELSQDITINKLNLRSVLRSKALRKIRQYCHKIESSNRQGFAIEKILADCEQLRKALVNLLFRTGFIAEKDRKKMDEIALKLADLVQQKPSS